MYGYTPDCKYPAVYGERGVLGLSIKTKLSDNSQNVLTDFSANFDRSAVPDILHYSINNKAFDIKENVLQVMHQTWGKRDYLFC